MIIDLGGTIRARDPKETLEVIKPYIKKAGITRIANLTYLDCIEIPVYTCIRPKSKNLSTSQGKGITDDLAKCSAYMEAIEHYFSEQTHVDKHCHFDELPEGSQVDINLFSRGLIDCPEMKEHIKQWTLCESLLHDNGKYFPTEYFCFDLSSPCLENSFFRKTTTGLASGNTLTEATCHAIYECIERNCSFDFAHMPHPEKLERILDNSTINYPAVHELLDRLKENHIDCVIFNTTNHLNVPTYHAIIADDNPFRKLGHYSGTGTHLHDGIAICRAITEAVQSRLTYIAGSRDDMYPKDYKISWKPLKLSGKKEFGQTHENVNFTLDEQLTWLLNCLEENNYHPYRYCHTQETDDISVVKILIPGLDV